jgi:hypothetical protein
MGRLAFGMLLVVAVVAAALWGFSGTWRRPVRDAQDRPSSATTSHSQPDTSMSSQPSPDFAANLQSPSKSTEDKSTEEWFREITDQTGIDFIHRSGDSPEKPFPAANGSGIGVIDFDRDGWDDLYFATGTDFPLDPDRREPFNRLFRAVGAWKFVEVTGSAGAQHAGFSAGVAVGDYDNDGFPDLYVSCYGRNCLFHNMGDGTFVRCEQEAGVDDPRWGASVAWLDGNADGWLDLYVCNYAKWSLETHQYCGDRTRNIRVHCSPTSVEPEDDLYYINQGDGTFRDGASEAGLRVKPGRGQGVLAVDLDQNGYTDIYVANDLNANMLFFNRGDGTFEDASESSGTAHDWRGTNQAGMGVDAADYNNDGRIDLVVTNYSDEHNVIYENLSGRFFRDNSRAANLVASSFRWIGWGVALVDFNLDGQRDLLVTNGHVDNNRHLLGQDAPYRQPALLWRGTGGRFELLEAPGDYFRQLHVGRALVVFDPNQDGAPDVMIGHQDGRPAMLANVAASGRPRCTVRVWGRLNNRDAIGTTVVAIHGDRRLVQPVKSGGSYLSSGSHLLFFSFPKDVSQWLLEIHWPGGNVSATGPIQPGWHYDIYEPTNVLPLEVHARRLAP